MFEDTNQALDAMDVADTDVTEFDDLFSDAEPAEEPAAEQDTAQADAPEETPKAEETPEVLEVKYLQDKWAVDRAAAEQVAQGMGVTPEALIATLQKGLNYDRLSDKHRSNLSAAEQAAQRLGVTVEQFFGQFEQAFIKQQENEVYEKELRALVQLYPGHDPQALQDLARDKARIQLAAQEQERARLADQQAQAKRQPLVELFEAHPDFDPQNAPPELLERVINSASPLAEYTLYLREQEIEQIKAEHERQLQELKTQKQNTINKEKAIGSAAGSDGESGEDDFTKSFLSVF